jgi:hypothetical protein
MWSLLKLNKREQDPERAMALFEKGSKLGDEACTYYRSIWGSNFDFQYKGEEQYDCYIQGQMKLWREDGSSREKLAKSAKLGYTLAYGVYGWELLRSFVDGTYDEGKKWIKKGLKVLL